jgi:hypothetical protein
MMRRVGTALIPASFSAGSRTAQNDASLQIPENTAQQKNYTSDDEYEIVINKDNGEEAPYTGGDLEISYLGNSLYKDSFQTSPPNENEIDAAIESMVERPELLRSIVPGGAVPESMALFSNPDAMKSAMNHVKNIILNDSRLLKSAQQKRDEKNQGQHQQQRIPTYEEILDQLIDKDASDSLSKPSQEWEELKNKYPCAICQDVLADPTNLNCSHSYCGSCLSDHLTYQHCDTDSEDEDEDGNDPHSDKTIHFCPTCRDEITKVTFVRGWAEDIDRQVGKVVPVKQYLLSI